MKAIKVCEANKTAIEAALKAANGKAYDHAYTTYDEIESEANAAEKKLLALVPKSQAPGASFASTSGNAVPNAYKYARKATRIKLERRSAAWWLTEVEATEVYKEGGKCRLTLTASQDAKAVSEIRARYSIAPTATA